MRSELIELDIFNQLDFMRRMNIFYVVPSKDIEPHDSTYDVEE